MEATKTAAQRVAEQGPREMRGLVALCKGVLHEGKLHEDVGFTSNAHQFAEAMWRRASWR